MSEPQPLLAGHWKHEGLSDALAKNAFMYQS